MERLKQIIEINILFGAWLLAAPFVLGYSSSHLEMGNDLAMGVLLIACSWWILAATAGQLGAAALQLLSGIWLIVAPFLWHYARSSRPFTNDIIMGIAAVFVGATVLRMLESKLKRAA
jgi:hypothetical protein